MEDGYMKIYAFLSKHSLKNTTNICRQKSVGIVIFEFSILETLVSVITGN